MRKVYLLLISAMLIAGITHAATKTWNGGTGVALNWTTAANWFPVGAPLAADDVVFSTAGVLTFTTGPGASFSFNSLTISAGTVTLIGTGGSRTFTLGGAAGTDFTVSTGASLTLGTNLSITMASSATGDISGTLTVNASRTFNSDGASVVTTVTGAIVNSGTVTCATATKLLMNSGSSYQHSLNAGTIPTATWASSSTCNISGTTATFPSGFGQTYGNLTFSCSPTSNISFNATPTCNDFTIAMGGTNTLRITNNTTDRSVTVNGNFSQTSGNFAMVSDDGDATLDIAGNFSVSGGTFDFNDDNGAGIAALNVAGDFSHTAGTITRSDPGGSGSANIFFDGSSAQTFTSGGTVGTGVNYTINSAATLNMAAAGTIVSGNSFTLSSGGSLGITSTAGIVTAPTASGNIQTITRTFNTAANYNYMGSGAQVNGNALPATINNFTINNSTGLTLSQAVAINGALTMTNGIITADAGELTVNASGTTSGASNASYVHGPVTKIGTSDFIFPIGKSPAGYHAVGLTNISVSETFTAEYIRSSATALGGSNTPLTHVSNCEYWDVDRVGTASANVVLYWTASSGCNANGYVNNLAALRVAHHNGATWDNQGTIATSGTTADGNVTSATVTSFSPFTLGAINFNPLPVKFSNIKAFEKASGVQIDWTTFAEVNVVSYVIERSADGKTFSAIGNVAAVNSPNATNYGFFDANPISGTNFYRLRNVDIDGKSGFSNIVRVDLGNKSKDIIVYPNPVRSGAYLSYGSGDLARGNYSARIFNAAGQQIYLQKFSHNGGAINQTIQLPVSARPGLHTLQLEVEGVKVAGKSFLVQ